eukprot:scaffold47365_cov68-Attheya_sp.AAC.2
MIQRKAVVDLSHDSKHTTQQQTDDEETNTPTAEEIDEEGGSLSSIHENGRLFGDKDNESEVDEDEIEIQFDIEAQDELLNEHESQDDAGLTDTGARVEVPKDPEIIPEGLGYDDIGIITDNMLDIVVPHSTADVLHNGFDFLVQHPTLDTVVNTLRKSFPVVPQPKQTIVSLDRDDFGEDMNPLLRKALER